MKQVWRNPSREEDDMKVDPQHGVAPAVAALMKEPEQPPTSKRRAA